MACYPKSAQNEIPFVGLVGVEPTTSRLFVGALPTFELQPNKRKNIYAVIVAATYFPQCVSSIIGAIAFNFRVRKGTGWIHDAKPPLSLSTYSIYFVHFIEEANPRFTSVGIAGFEHRVTQVEPEVLGLWMIPPQKQSTWGLFPQWSAQTFRILFFCNYFEWGATVYTEAMLEKLYELYCFQTCWGKT